MLLTVSKRVEFSASRRLARRDWSSEQNIAAFGSESSARYGTGRNYIAFFVFSGRVNPETGMLMNISEIKTRVGQILHDGFDHKFLNEDNAAFGETVPTAENVARQLFVDAAPLFCASEATLVACHLSESPERSATVYAGGRLEANYWFSFSAARQTTSPHLSSAENQKLFGRAASPFGHGHNYRARLTLDAAAKFDEVERSLDSLRAELDHKNLNHEVAGLTNCPLTTETLAHYLFKRVECVLPVSRVRLHEREDFFAEYHRGGAYFLGMQLPFSAAHRLHSASLPAEESAALYGKCNNPRGHGHRYVTEATIGGEYDERSGTLADFAEMRRGIEQALAPWMDRHLDLETEEFRATPSTGENIVHALWPKLDRELDERLVRLRLWETANNRFTLRR